VNFPDKEEPMDFKKHLEIAWQLTLKFIGPLILMTLVMVVVSCLTLGILAPVTMAGYIQSILLMVRDGREPKTQDIFSQMRLFFPLLGFGIIAVVAILVGFALLVIPGIIVALAISFSCLYMLPLMTDRKMGLIAAIKESHALARQEAVLDHIVVILIFVGITGIGSSIFIGWLFTQPLGTVFLLSVYEEKTNQVQQNQPLVPR
jgi:hypothetical protein